MKIAIGTLNKAKTGAVENIINAHVKEVQYIYKSVQSGVSEQPFSNEETRRGAINRAINAMTETGATYSFGLEGGVEEIDGIMYCVNWGAVALKNGHIYTAQGASFMLPNEIANKLREGKELGPVMDEYMNTQGIRHTEGAVGIFTKGLIDRKGMFEHIVKLLIGEVYYFEKMEKM